MGCDGGTIPRRNELVKVKKKPETKDKTSHLIFEWRYCNLTQQLLQRPIVACGFGKLYNKSSIIEAIIDKEAPAHVKSLKDIVDLNLTPNPEFDGTLDTAQYICPITGLEMAGKFRFVVIWSCGCVFAERALREVGMGACPKCLKSFQGVDVVVLNPTVDEVTAMQKNMEIRRRQRKRGCFAKNHGSSCGIKKRKC